MVNANRRDISISMLWANLIPLLIGIPIAFAQLALFVALRGAMRGGLDVSGILLFALVMVVSIVAHELIHGLTWQVVARAAPATISYGFQWKTLTPYARLSGQIEVGAYRIGGMMPGLLLGVIPYFLSLALGDVPLLVFSVLHTLGAGGDWLILWLLRTVPPGTLVEDHPTRAGCYVFDHEGS